MGGRGRAAIAKRTNAEARHGGEAPVHFVRRSSRIQNVPVVHERFLGLSAPDAVRARCLLERVATPHRMVIKASLLLQFVAIARKLDVRRSGIRAAGLGVFALVAIADCMCVGFYDGVAVTLSCNESSSDAVLTLCEGVHIDGATEAGNWTSCVNDSKRLRADVSIVGNLRVDSKGLVYTCKSIAPGDELFWRVGYSASFWEVRAARTASGMLPCGPMCPKCLGC